MSVLNKAASGNGHNKIDTEDAIMAPAFLIGTMAMSGIASISIFDYALTDAAFSVGQTGITWAFLVAVAALGFAYATNGPALDKMDDVETYAVGGTVLLLLANEFVPQVNDLIVGSDVVGLIAVALMSGGYYAVAYLG
jgi:hypothetical protein